ncbi:MAG: sensor histidine kinase [Crocinitomicaceae bacterium]
MRLNHLLSLISLLFLFHSTFAQEELIKLEDYILLEQKDSARLYLNEIDEKSEFNAIYKDLIESETPSYSNLLFFVRRMNSRSKVKHNLLNSYIDRNVSIPNNKKSINLDYVQIKWYQITDLRNETQLSESNEEHVVLENYISQFNSSNPSVIKAQVLADSHRSVLAVIQQDLESGLAITESIEKRAYQLKDTSLIILSNYHKSDFLMVQGNLQEYINVSEHSLLLESLSTKKSDYYVGTIVHLVDAYIYQGSNTHRVRELLKQLYRDEKSRVLSYSLYAKYLGTLDLSSNEAIAILNQFQADDLVTFCDTVYQRAMQSKVNSNELYQLTRECGVSLEKQENFKESLRFMKISRGINQKIYSAELSETLAEYKSKEIVSKKDVEIELEKQKSKLYIVTIGLIGGSLLLVAFGFLQKGRQAKKLEEKNNQIKSQRDAIQTKEAEKALLLKEVHHRVKNNFQIITSLLDIQARQAEDTLSKEYAIESKNRIKSMALIHQSFYQNDGLTIDIKSFIKNLISEINNSYSSDNQPDISIKTEDFILDIDTAIPIGLIINELVSNAFKYGFGTQNPALEVTLKRTHESGKYALEIADNGPGLPVNFDFENAKSLGLKLVQRLTKQLHGNFVYSNVNECRFVINFKDSKLRAQID